MKSVKEEIYSVKVKHSAQERFDKRYGKTCGKIKTAIKITVCRKSMFFQKSACSQSLSPLGHSDGFASCKAWFVLISASLPKTPFPGKGAILLGLPPLVLARMLAVSHTRPLHDAVAQMADDLYGGYAPATPFLYNQEVYRQSEK